MRETEALVKRVLKGDKPAKAKSKQLDPDIRRLENDVSERLGAAVSIKHGRSGKGTLSISYGSLEQLDGILERLLLGSGSLLLMLGRKKVALRNVPFVVWQSVDDPKVPPGPNQFAAKEIEAAKERGKTLDWKATRAQLLAELGMFGRSMIIVAEREMMGGLFFSAEGYDRFTEQHRVVLPAAGQHLDDALELGPVAVQERHVGPGPREQPGGGRSYARARPGDECQTAFHYVPLEGWVR